MIYDLLRFDLGYERIALGHELHHRRDAGDVGIGLLSHDLQRRLVVLLGVLDLAQAKIAREDFLYSFLVFRIPDECGGGGDALEDLLY